MIVVDKRPEISVVMPVYNAERYVREAIESILNQTNSNFELIIIDDCGTDSSMDIAQEMKDERIRIVHNTENRGIAYSRNRGLELAKGKYIALMDDDDIAPSNRFELETHFLEEHKDIDVVGGGELWIDENGKVISYADQIICNPKRIQAELIFWDVIENGSAMMRTEFIRKNNLKYEDGYLGMEDYKFWTECSVVGNIANIDRVLLYWRKTYESETFRAGREQAQERRKKFAEIQKNALHLNGFDFSEKEEKLFTECFAENKREYIGKSKLEQLCSLLKKMMMQAEKNKQKNVEELKFVCRRMYALKTENSELWEDMNNVSKF